MRTKGAFLSDFGFRISDGTAAAAAALAGVAAALLLAGCAGGPPRSMADAGHLALAVYQDKQAAAPTQGPAAPAPDRFAELRKRQPAADVSTAPAPSAAAKPDAKSPGVAAAESPAPPAPARLAGFVDPLTKSGDRAPVSLESCLRRALANNLGIQIARFGPAIARTGVLEAEALFDPSWFMNNSLVRVRRQSGSFFTGMGTFSSRQWDFATGLETMLETGATVSLSQDWTFLHNNSAFYMPNPQYDSDLGLTVRQPLLRRAGVEVNRSPIVLARFDHTISLADFKVRLMGTLLDVEQTYWDLVVAETRVQALGEALAAARENQRIAQRRFEEGRDKRVIVSLAQSAAASREADLVAARLALTQTSDRLKRLIRDDELPLTEPIVLEATERPLTEPIPVGREALQSSMIAAMKFRPEMEQAEARLAQASLRERVARSDRLPQLDLAAGYTLNGLDRALDRSIDREFTTEYFDWSVGVEFRVPIGNRSREAAYERSRLERSRVLFEREDTRQRVLLEVSDAVRNLAAAEESIRATRAARLAAEQALRDQQANVDAGAALVKNLLDAQRDLADAKVREVAAMASYMTAMAAVERAKGTLLDYNNIRVLEDESKAPHAG